MSDWLDKALADFGITETLSRYRFEGRKAQRYLPICFGMEAPEYFQERCTTESQDDGSVHVHLFSNIIVHHGDIFGLGLEPRVSGSIGYIPQDASMIQGQLSFGKQFVYDKLYMLATTHHSAHNFYHFMVDYFTSYDYSDLIDEGATLFFFSKRISDFHFSAMKLLYGRCFPIMPFATSYLFRRLAIPSSFPKTAVVDFLRKAARSIAPVGSGRRVYISRRSADVRRVVNEDDLIRSLYKFGFEIIESETLSLEQQISLFKSADIICAPHGAGLSNIAYCIAGSAVVELFLTERLPLSAVFWELGCAAGVFYYLVGARRVHNEIHPYAGEGDLFVDPVHLEDALAHAIKSREHFPTLLKTIKPFSSE